MNKKLDLGKEKIQKLLLAFSIPCIISMVINSIYNIVDQIFIVQGVGYVGNAATNVIFPIVILCNAIAGLLGNGCAANLSLRLGEKKEKEAAKSVASTISFTIVLSIICSVIFYIMLPVLIKWFGCTENVYPYAYKYGRIILLGAPFMITYSALSSIIRADGSPRYSMLVLVTGAIINIILDALFILKFHMGVEGGALATILGQMISCIMALLYIKKFKSIKLERKDFKINKSILKVCSYGLSSFVTQATVLALFIFMNNIMTHYGALSKFGADIPLSVYGVVSKLNNLFVSSVLGVAIGAQPIIGYNYGAGNYERVKKTLRIVVFVNFIIGVIFNLCIYLFPKQLIGLFGSKDNILYLSFAVDCCRIFLRFCFLNAFEMTCSIVIQSLGNVKKATAVSFTRQIILFIPLALLLTSFIGLYGALYAGIIADVCCFIVVIFIFTSEYRKITKRQKIENKEKEISIKEVSNIPLKQNHVITINREYGSGGRYVGKLLAKILNIKFYDKEIISLAAKESKYEEEYIKEHEQKKKMALVSAYNNEDEIFIAEARVIEKLAKKESCVIVGRCADYILKDYNNVTKIFLYSDSNSKINRVVNYYGLSKKKALKQIDEINMQRKKHYKYYTNLDWKDFSHYDITLNVDTLGVEKTANILADFISKQE